MLLFHHTQRYLELVFQVYYDQNTKKIEVAFYILGIFSKVTAEEKSIDSRKST
jgi:hypothetical protein